MFLPEVGIVLHPTSCENVPQRSSKLLPWHRLPLSAPDSIESHFARVPAHLKAWWKGFVRWSLNACHSYVSTLFSDDVGPKSGTFKRRRSIEETSENKSISVYSRCLGCVDTSSPPCPTLFNDSFGKFMHRITKMSKKSRWKCIICSNLSRTLPSGGQKR